MMVLYSPQFNEEKKIVYSFVNNVITATIDTVTDTFDLSLLPDGAEVDDVETTLPTKVLISAINTSGVIHAVLLNWIDGSATNDECFPLEITV